jgi:hypothetical protein
MNISYQTKYIVLLGFFIGALLSLPKVSLAARQCPANLTLDPSQNNACVDTNHNILGTALDPATAGACTSGVPMLKSGTNVCVNADGQPVGATGAPTKTASPVGATKPQVPKGECDGFLDSLSPTCLWISATTWISALLISIAVMIMSLVAWLFNLTIEYTVLGFSKTLITGQVLEAISFGWSFFRDLANIAIIGLFVFIAINIILGNKTYGERKLIARVLIVAVLINFSFLFTRIVINFSNAIAIQFATKMETGVASATKDGKPPNIAGEFTKLMGVSTISQTQDSLAQIAKNQTFGSFIALMHAFFTVVLVLGVAIVLFYATILLLARALIFIFLLVTSSIAFATYLLPTLASSDFGWKAWWQALFRNALLAPVMMLFLLITLNISKALSAGLKPVTGAAGAGASGGVLGALAARPDDPKNLSALLIYIIVLGLLYGAIRISNKFSGAAGQFAWAGTAPFANSSVGVPLRSLGFLGRNTIGRGAAALGKGFQNAAKGRDPGSWGRFTYDTLAQIAKRPAKLDFNAGNLTNIKSAQTSLGGFAGQQERKQKAGLDRTERNTFKDAELDKARKDAIDQARRENPDAAKQHDASQQTLEAAKKAKEAAEAQLKSANVNKESSTAKLTDLKQRHDAMDEGAAKDAVKREIAKEEGEFKKAGDAISRAEENARAQSTRVTEVENAGKPFADLLEKRAQALMPKGVSYKPEVNESGRKKTYTERLGDSAAEEVFKRWSNAIPRMAGMSTRETDSLSKEMRRLAKDHETQKELKKVVSELNKVKTEEEKHTATAREAKAEAHEDAAATREAAGGHGAAPGPAPSGDH